MCIAAAHVFGYSLRCSCDEYDRIARDDLFNPESTAPDKSVNKAKRNSYFASVSLYFIDIFESRYGAQFIECAAS